MNKRNVMLVNVFIIIFIWGVMSLNTKTLNMNKVEEFPIGAKESNIYEETKESFFIEYKGKNITPGTEFSEDLINAKAIVSEISSCAFDGIDQIYTYDNIEITVASIDGKNKVYEVYFIDSTMETSEGVKISDKKETMIEKYGTEYKNEFENQYTYTKDNVDLTFIINNDIITGITYTLEMN